MENFYKLKWAKNEDEVFLKALVSYNDQALKRGDFRPSEPFRLKIDEGKNLYDLVHYQDPFNFALSEKVYEALNKAKLSGWNVYPITLEGRKEKYYGFQVLGRSGGTKKPKETGFVIGYDFDRSTWDGSDFFIPDGTLRILCTEKAKEVLINKEFKGIELENIKNVEWYNA
jgi:hypothetical protein